MAVFSSAEDLKRQQAQWGEPIVGSYRDLTLYQTPAPYPRLYGFANAQTG
jgi:gamma-glutamyltranspeptidase